MLISGITFTTKRPLETKDQGSASERVSLRCIEDESQSIGGKGIIPPPACLAALEVGGGATVSVDAGRLDCRKLEGILDW